MAEKTLTKEEWAQVDSQLSGLCGRVEMMVDGRNVTLTRGRISQNTLGVVVYIDGEWKGTWIGKTNDCPEQPYTYPKQRFVYTSKSRAEQKKMIKRFGKRRCKEIGITAEDVDRKITIWQPMFPSAKAVRRHYEKTFQSIELVKVGF